MGVIKECQRKGRSVHSQTEAEQRPWWEKRWEEGKGPTWARPPEAAAADMLHVCGHGGFVDSWLSSQRSRAEARPEWPACLTSQSPQGCLLYLPPNPLPHLTQWIPVPAWEVVREGLCTLWLDKAQSRTNRMARHQHQEPEKGGAGREWPPPQAGRGLAERTLLDPLPSQSLVGDCGQCD